MNSLRREPLHLLREGDDVLDGLQAIRHARLHGRSHAQGLVNPREVVMELGRAYAFRRGVGARRGDFKLTQYRRLEAGGRWV